MINKYHYDKNNKAEWHSVRDKVSGLGDLNTVRFGGSQVSAVLGKNKYEPKQRLFYNHLGQFLNKIDSRTMATGLFIEDFIKRRYMAYSTIEEEDIFNMKNNNYVNKLEDSDYILTNDNYQHLFVSLDYVRPSGEAIFHSGEVTETGFPVDMKNVKFNVWKTWNNTLPENYSIQSQVQQMVYGSDYSEMAVLIGGDEFVVYPVYKDQKLRDQILWACDEFALSILKAKQVKLCIDSSKSQEDREMYTEVLQSLEPPIDFSDSQTELLYERYSEADGNLKKGNNHSDLLAKRYLRCNDVIKLAEQYKTFCKNKLLAYIEGANGTLSQDYKVSRVSKEMKPNFRISKLDK